MNITEESSGIAERGNQAKWIARGFDAMFEQIEFMVKQYPNDKMLGEAIRKLVNESK